MSEDSKVLCLEQLYAFTAVKEELLLRQLNSVEDFRGKPVGDECKKLLASYEKVVNKSKFFFPYYPF